MTRSRTCAGYRMPRSAACSRPKWSNISTRSTSFRLLAVAFQKLRPGSKIVLETINPQCWFAFFDSYLRDITHAQPLHPDTLQYLLVASGFQRTTVRYSAPYPEHAKLQHVALASRPVPTLRSSGLTSAVAVVNANVDKLNRLLFTHMDYAAIGERL